MQKTRSSQPGKHEIAVPELPEKDLHIAIPAELLLQLLSQNSIKACQIRCLNSQSAAQLREFCMNCCARNLFDCAGPSDIEVKPVTLHTGGYPTQ